MRQVSYLRVEVNCSIPDDAKFAEVARRWMEHGLALFPSLFAELQSGEAHGMFIDQPRGGRMVSRKFSLSGWEKRLGALKGRPEGLTLAISNGPDETTMPDESSPDTHQDAEITVIDGHIGMPGQVRLVVHAIRTPELMGSDGGECVRSFLEDCVGDVSIDYGDVRLDGNRGHATSLDSALRRDFIASIQQSKEFLRGYGWITVCPSELVERVGGTASLEASKAFADIRVQRSGDVLLQATDSPEEFDQDALRRVWSALGPVLHPGGPQRRPGHEDDEVILEDAASLQ
ncbi:hypothetical protein E1263_17105 [Kribbella antibiotica]|uniref:DUF3396 domain-containing protein n=1 Tax=Kribbella antibiotica TaxID=190195 RepID=A0A4R4ZJH5_9ACTN|nr:hypothetical protein [Kribbella antibiotica]TDD58901.1 hypothetical protein E1263_17105 [Kribbella antibiotica]